MTVIHNIKIDLQMMGVKPIVNVVQADNNTRVIKAELYSGGMPFTVGEDIEVSLACVKPDRTKVWYDTLPDGEAAATVGENTVSITLAPAVLEVAGTAAASIVFRSGLAKQVASFPFLIHIVNNPAAGEVISNSYYRLTSLDDLNEAWEELKQSLADGLSVDLRMNNHSITDVNRIGLIPADDTEGVCMEALPTIKDKNGGVMYAVLLLTESTVDGNVVIRGVAPGVEDTDAATVRQIKGVVRFDEEQSLAEKQQAQARQNIGIDNAVTDEKYFDIDDNGVVSLKEEYRAGGSNIAELPEKIIIPDVVNGTAVTALQDSMLKNNNRIKSITIPGLVTTIPKGFANKAINLTEINGTENVEVICQVAFQKCGIKKALFPNLKTFDGAGQFNVAADLAIVDIGNTVTTIPNGCFNACEKLSAIRGGASVTSVGDIGLSFTHNLRNLPFAGNLKSIGKQGLIYSRVNFDWWNLEGCTFGADATPAQYNATDWWTGCTYTACENELGSAFHQRNPEWAGEYIPNSSDTYGTGCLEISTTHIYSALTGVKFDSPRYFVETIVGGIDNGRLLTPTGSEDGEPAYCSADMVNWLNALGLNAEMLSGGWNNTNLQKVYDALAEGALVQTFIKPSHAGVIYGVTSNGEMMVLESDAYQRDLGRYEPTRIKIRIQNLTVAGADVIVVKR